MIDELKVEEPKKEKPEELKIQERPEIPQIIGRRKHRLSNRIE